MCNSVCNTSVMWEFRFLLKQNIEILLDFGHYIQEWSQIVGVEEGWKGRGMSDEKEIGYRASY